MNFFSLAACFWLLFMSFNSYLVLGRRVTAQRALKLEKLYHLISWGTLPRRTLLRIASGLTEFLQFHEGSGFREGRKQYCSKASDKNQSAFSDGSPSNRQ